MTAGNCGAVSDVGSNDYIVTSDDAILVTGANGFIGSRVVRALLRYGFTRVRCFTRPLSGSRALQSIAREFGQRALEIVEGNLLSRDDCRAACQEVSVVYHLAAGTEKTFPGCFLNSVVTTRNLLDALVNEKALKRFVNVSSLSVYSNENIRRGGLMDESCEIDAKLVERHDPYAYAKAKQDDLVLEYGRTNSLPYVIVRPGVTFGPGKANIPGRIGNNTFGVFLHIGLRNRMPLTYVDNCAEAIVLAGLRNGIQSEVINIVDDDLPTSREFIRVYKKRARNFVSVPVPYPAFYVFSYLWERYSKWSEGQLPPVFNRRACAVYYKGNTYSNKKAKELLGWRPRVGMNEALERFCAYAREAIATR
jgi:nucleoside-diphosphate-sugar epimerase